jgi:hypothetical protein
VIYAQINGSARMPALPMLSGARCPTCQGAVHPKCGQIKAWHWAHTSNVDCDEWAEPDSAWHQGWQSQVTDDHREVVIGRHRADIVTPAGIVVELQHSSISPAEIAERERFYGHRMVWLFDTQNAHEAQRLTLRKKQGTENIYTFRWRQPRKSIGFCRRTVWLDLDGTYLLKLGRIYTRTPCGGWGRLFRADDFIAALESS